VDAKRFDFLTRAFTSVRSRRRLLPLLAGLPAASALPALLAESAQARKRSHRHDRGDGNRVSQDRKRKKKRKKKCRPRPPDQTCAGKCGTVLNNCKKAVDCGPCPCDPPCPQCEICDEQSVTCQPDPDSVGDPCGDPGQLCQADGACACAGDSCGLCRACQGGDCQPEPVDTPCGNSRFCCGNPIACVDIKTDPDHCGGCGQACPAGHICRKAVCELCVCPGVDGCFVGMQDAVDAALDGDVIRICEGVFLGGFGAFSVPAGLTLTVIGAGSGLNPNSNTILDGGGGPMVQIAAGATVALRDLRIMDGNATGDGGGVRNHGALTMRDCAVSNNEASGDGGGIANAAGATLTLTDCRITQNEAGATGGGVHNVGALTVNGVTSISENTAATGGGGLTNVLGGVAEINNAASISDNEAQVGGGVFNGNSLTLNNASSVHDNTASLLAGGVHNDFGGAVTLNNTSSVAGNQAPQGGGVLNQSGTITLNNSSRIHDNEAAGDGGGIDNDAVVTLNDNSSIDHNTAGGNGGGIFNQGTVNRGPGSSIADNDPDDCVDDGTGTGCV
jgi:hypothetical protein